MKKGFHYIIFFLALSLLGSCSSKKNTATSRFYHSLTSRYNIYYNGKMAYDEALDAMQKGYKENYSEQLLMYPISAQPKDKSETGGAFDRSIDKGEKAIKLHSIKAKPKKKPGWSNDPKQVSLQAQNEYNPFLKKCWLLIGESQFYNADFLQASATFSYIARHYSTDEEMVTTAKLWQARCYNEMDWLYESEDILKKLNTNGIPKKNLNQYAEVNAHYLLLSKQAEEALPYLQTTIKAEKNRLQRARLRYLLGQLYTELQLNNLAYKSFGKVISSNPPYELEFAARIRQTEVLTGADTDKVVKMLTRMAKNQKNKDYLDQVYYALGNVYLSINDTVQAIKSYNLGIEKSVQNGMDKAICQIKLGDLYFTLGDYIHAQPCFSGALSGIQKEFKDYERISKLSAVLDELVVHAEAVHLQDSLQTVAKMPETERLALIDKIIEQVIKDEEEAKKQADKEAFLADQAAQGTGIERPGTDVNVQTIPTVSGKAGFYFYNTQAVAQGKTQFQRKWGRRTLEDDWRRRKKEMSTFELNTTETQAGEEGETLEEGGLSADSTATDLPEDVSDDPKKREYYLQQLPFTEEDIAASNIIIIDGLYNMAMIYKDKLEDFPLSIRAFEELERRFPDHEHLLESYYQVYLLALRTKDPALATSYIQKLTNAFPESDYAIAISDPNYEHNIRTMDSVQDSLYEATYAKYLESDTTYVRRSFSSVEKKYPLASLMPKFMFLNALTYVQTGDVEGFKLALKALLDKYPSADVAELAGEMLKGVLRGRSLIRGDVRGMTWNLRFGAEGELTAADTLRTFDKETNTPHRMLFVYPTKAVDKNKLLFAVAAYNFANFMVKQFDIEIEEMDEISMLHIRGFINLEEIIHYYEMIYGKDGYANALADQVAILPISDNNYDILMRGKTLDDYVNFFDKHFGEHLSALRSRWEKTKTSEKKIEKQNEVEVKDTIPTLVVPIDTVSPPTLPIDTIPARPITKDTVPTLISPIDSVPSPIQTDSIPTVSPATPAEPKETESLSMEDIEAIRKQEAAEEEAKKEEARKAFKAQQEADRLMKERIEKEQAELFKKQKEEEEALLKAKEEEEKRLEKERKAKLKQAEADRKAKEKARKQLLKEKERAYKERLKQKEAERKQKEKEYKAKLKAKEAAQKQKRKEAEAKRRQR